MNDKNEHPIDHVLRSLSHVNMTPSEARAAQICPTCGQKIGTFKDDLSRSEYRISGCCQACQDDVFENDDAAGMGITIIGFNDDDT